MDEIWITIITAVLTIVIGFFIGKFKEKTDNMTFEDMYMRYKLFFDISGMIVKGIDEQLYQEMDECIKSMKEAYESPSFTTDAFNEIVDEATDVFNRAKELIEERTKTA